MTQTARGGVLWLIIAACVLTGCNFGKPPTLEELDTPTALPQPTTTYLALGRRLLDLQDYKTAKDAFVRSLRIEGQTAGALSGAGVAAEKQGLLGEAKQYFELAVNLVPDSVVAHNNLGAVLYRLGEYHAAKQAFLAAFALSSGTNGVANRNLGITELAIRREEQRLVPITENPRALQRLGSGEYKLRTDTKTDNGEDVEG